MIAGIGSDIIDIRRIERLLTEFGERFERRLFTDGEIALARSRKQPAVTYATRFAAKEAFAKALGSGLRGIQWREIEVVRDALGKPSLILHGRAATLTEGAKAHLSLSDDYPYAQAFVIIER